MKIVMLQDDFPPHAKGGAGIAVSTLSQELRREGHEIYIISTVQSQEMEGITNWNGIFVYNIYSQYPARWRAYVSLFNYKVVRQVEDLLRNIKPDIVHAHNVHQYLSYASLKAAKRLGHKVVLTAHDTMLFDYGKSESIKPSQWSLVRKYKFRYNPLRQWFIKRLVLTNVDQIIAVSHALAEALVSNGFRKVMTIHNGLDVDRWSSSDESIKEFKNKYGLENTKVILYAGRISELKGSKQAVLVLNEVRKRIPKAELLVLGKKLEGAVSTGWIEGEKLKAAYGASDVVIYPSIYLDPFGLIILEAMAAKKPVVASSFGGAKEIVEDGVSGFVVNPLEVKAFSTCVEKIIGDDARAAQMGEAGFKRVSEFFSVKDMTSRYLDLYRGV